MGTSESDSASTKADVIGRHRKHDAIESKSASKGVGSGTGSTVANADSESTTFASDKVDVPVDATKYAENDSTVDLTAPQHYAALPVAKTVGKSPTGSWQSLRRKNSLAVPIPYKTLAKRLE